MVALLFLRSEFSIIQLGLVLTNLLPSLTGNFGAVNTTIHNMDVLWEIGATLAPNLNFFAENSLMQIATLGERKNSIRLRGIVHIFFLYYFLWLRFVFFFVFLVFVYSLHENIFSTCIHSETLHVPLILWILSSEFLIGVITTHFC